jgi:hypothetical protein
LQAIFPELQGLQDFAELQGLQDFAELQGFTEVLKYPLAGTETRILSIFPLKKTLKNTYFFLKKC